MQADGDVRWVPVREVGDVRMGKQLSPAGREAAVQFPYLRVANVFEGRIDLSDVKTMGFSSSERKLYQLLPGDVLLNEGQENLRVVGRSALYSEAPGAYCFQNTLIRFRPGPHVLPEYAQQIFVWWRLRGVFANIAEKTSISHLGANRFGSLLFPCRPLREQRRIVDVVEAGTAQERAIEKSIAKLMAVRLALVAEWLRETDRNTPLGSALARLEVGVASAGPEDIPGRDEWGVIRLGAVTAGRFVPTQVKRLPKSVAPRPELEIHSGDVLMVRVNGSPELVGSVCVVDSAPPRLMLSDLVMRLVADRRVMTPDFLGLALSAPVVREQIVGRLRGTSGQFQLPQSELKSVLLPCPSPAEQQRILGALAAFDAKIAKEQSELDKFRAVRQGLLGDLLAGG
ncbi:restriction endonuclease subunit S [Streptomyces sp. NPDC051217]|uniref:restriction endonuclease subunit S n=1 Tax=Streptomyces sp. NPDC051217 TaxID=3365644 RepID=UPI00378EBAE6